MKHVTCEEWEERVRNRDWEQFVRREYYEENGESGREGGV